MKCRKYSFLNLCLILCVFDSSFFFPHREKMPSLQWCMSLLKLSASGNSTGAQRSFGERSQAKDNGSFRGSSTPSHSVGNRKVTGSQDDNIYVSIWFLASNYGCNSLSVWLCHVAPWGHEYSPILPSQGDTNRVQRWKLQGLYGMAGLSTKFPISH